MTTMYYCSEQEHEPQSRYCSGAVKNPFAYRSTNHNKKHLPLHRDDSATTAINTIGSTYIVKILTFVLIGFAGGLCYHMVEQQGGVSMMHNPFASNSALHHHHHQNDSHHEQMLAANDHIVHKLATENQRHQEELARLRQQLQSKQEQEQKQQEEKIKSNSSNLRRQQQQQLLLRSLEREDDKHALLWTAKVHEARLQAAQEQAEALLRVRVAKSSSSP